MFKFYIHAINHCMSWAQLDRILHASANAMDLSTDQHNYICWIAAGQSARLEDDRKENMRWL